MVECTRKQKFRDGAAIYMKVRDLIKRLEADGWVLVATEGSHMYRYLIIIESGEHNYSAYVPDLPGCITTGATHEEVQKNMRDAIALHLRGMIEDHKPIPVPQVTAAYADVPFPNSAA